MIGVFLNASVLFSASYSEAGVVSRSLAGSNSWESKDRR
jgi:hypothetical protein